MTYEFRILLFVMLAGTAVIYGVFLMPALTSGGSGPTGGTRQAAFEAALSEELAYCQQQTKALDCGCFANRSGMILSYDAPKVAAARYADQRQLARGQAADDC